MYIEPEFGPNWLHKYVYQGIWEKHDEPSYKRWIWTVKNAQALLALSVVAGLIAVTQGRSWNITRRFLLRLYKPVRLGAPEKLESLSQVSAVFHLLLPGLGILQRRRALDTAARQRLDYTSNSATVSVWFGVAALTNCIVFFTMGVAVPFLLADGALGSPVVRSMITNQCLTASPGDRVRTIIQQHKATDSVFRPCRDKIEGGCDEQYYVQAPNITKRTLDKCPFPGAICNNASKPIELTQSGITPLSIGINSISTTAISLNHRLTCVPVHLDHFITVFPKYDMNNSSRININNTIVLAVNDFWATNKTSGSFAMFLDTLNEPSMDSTEGSGLVRARANIQPDLRVLPSAIPDDEELMTAMHPDLATGDATPFLVVYRAGVLRYLSEMNDPLFSAHNYIAKNTERDLEQGYYADREATALGCLEKYQFCTKVAAKESLCSEWGKYSSNALDFFERTTALQSSEEAAEYVILIRFIPSLISTFEQLFFSSRISNLPPFTGLGDWASPGRWPGFDQETQWMTEVEMWFRKGLINGVLLSQHFVHIQVSDLNWTKQYFKSTEKLHLCGRVLFKDGSYTNINWIGLWTTTCSLLFICVLSLILECDGWTAIGNRARTVTGRRFHIRIPLSLFLFGSLSNGQRGAGLGSAFWRAFGPLAQTRAQAEEGRSWYGARPANRHFEGAERESEVIENIQLGEQGRDGDRVAEFEAIDDTI